MAVTILSLADAVPGARRPGAQQAVPSCSGCAGRLLTAKLERPSRSATKDRTLHRWRLGAGFGKPTAQESIGKARQTQLNATELLSTLLQAHDTRAKATQYVDNITEEFFLMASTYLEMAKKEDNIDVVSQLENVMKVCMEEKQKTLRPEIQLLNTLLATPSRDRRHELMTTPQSIEIMRMNNEYFDSLINRMIIDVDRQPAQNLALAQQLKDIQQQATVAKAS